MTMIRNQASLRLFQGRTFARKELFIAQESGGATSCGELIA